MLAAGWFPVDRESVPVPATGAGLGQDLWPRTWAASRLQAQPRRLRAINQLCHERRMDLLSSAAWDLSALPEPARTLVAELVAHPAAGDRASCSLNSQAGRFDFRAERLQNRRGSGGRILVNISHAEPRDLSVARRLADWSLAPQEKRRRWA